MNLEELLLLLRGMASGDSEAHAAHVDRCPTCTAARSWLERFLDATDAGPLEEPPASVAERAIEFFARQSVEQGRRRSWSLARLLHDTLGGPLPAGVRGTAIGRRLLYDVGWAQVDIEIREARLNPDAFHVTGQLLPADASAPPDIIAVLSSEGTIVAQAPGDATGIFVLPEVHPGSYRLEIWAPATGDAIQVEPLELGMEGQ